MGVYSWNIFDLIREAGVEVWMVLIILLLFSVISWAIIVSKILFFRRHKRETEEFFDIYYNSPRFSVIYSKSKGISANPFAFIFREGYLELNRVSKSMAARKSPDSSSGELTLIATEPSGLESVERAIRRAATTQISRYESALGFLATTGSTTPFIGLFGTVLGIIRSFHEIGIRGSASLATVAPGISEALVATAAGLAAAIPAVVAYNYFVNRIRGISLEMENFASEFLNLLERHLQISRQEERGGLRLMPQTEEEGALP